MVLVDLHMHSTESDGWQLPTQVVETAAAHSVKIMALSDHDCVSGVLEAESAAFRLGVHLVRAVEITTYPLLQVRHILGHNVDIGNPQLMELMSNNQSAWHNLTMAVLTSLHDAGIRDRNLDNLAERSMIMPNMLVKYLLDHAILAEDVAWGHMESCISSMSERLCRDLASPAEAVDAIHAAGGMAVGAHPGAVPDQDLMLEVLPLLDGLEVYTPHHTPEQSLYYEQLARCHGLYVTVGSDFHGYPGKPYDPVRGQVDSRYLKRLNVPGPLTNYPQASGVVV